MARNKRGMKRKHKKRLKSHQYKKKKAPVEGDGSDQEVESETSDAPENSDRDLQESEDTVTSEEVFPPGVDHLAANTGRKRNLSNLEDGVHEKDEEKKTSIIHSFPRHDQVPFLKSAVFTGRRNSLDMTTGTSRTEQKHKRSRSCCGSFQEFSVKQVENEDDGDIKATINVMEEISDLPLTATVYIAAPLLANHYLSIIGENEMLGSWENPQGTFRKIGTVNKTIHIFQGIVPVPTVPGSPFKFVNVNYAKKLIYEGDGPADNRRDEILPGSTSFFIYKPNSSYSSLLGKFFGGVSNLFSTSDAKEEIALGFYDIIYDHVLKNFVDDFDATYDFIEDGLKSVKKSLGLNYANKSVGFFRFLSKRLRSDEIAKMDCNELLFYLIGVCEMGVNFPDDFKEALNRQSTVFSIHLSRCQTFRRKVYEFRSLKLGLAHQAGSRFWWLIFHLSDWKDKLKNFDPDLMFKSIMTSLNEIPHVLLRDPEVASRVTQFLACGKRDVDEVYDSLSPIFERNANYRSQLEKNLFENLVLHKTKQLDDSKVLLQSKFLREKLENRSPTQDSSQTATDDFLDKLIVSIFDRRISDILTLASVIPDELLPLLVPFVQTAIEKKLKGMSYLTSDYGSCYNCLENKVLDKFPESKREIQDKFLTTTRQHLSSGSFQKIPSLNLILLGLSERVDIPFVKCANIDDLQSAIDALPVKFFQSLHSVIKKKPETSIDEVLKPFRKGETGDVVERLLDHFDQLDQILNKVRSLKIPLAEIPSLQDPRVLELLKYVGLKDNEKTEITKMMEELRMRHNLYGAVYTRFARLNVNNADSHTDVVDQESPNAENDGEAAPDSNNDSWNVPESIEEYQEKEEEENTNGSSTVIQILDGKIWEAYLRDVDFTQSVLTLQHAIDLALPLEQQEAVWLQQVNSCPLFFEKVWRPTVESTPYWPLTGDDLKNFVVKCSDEWIGLATRVATGVVPFEEMGEIVHLQPNADVLLCQKHYDVKRLKWLPKVYQYFKYFNELRYLFGPFVTALKSFEIEDREPINKLDGFVKVHLIDNWNQTTLVHIKETKLYDLLNNELGIYLYRPESQLALKFISSLANHKDETPLIDWLREKSEEDMKSMGRILKGTLFEAYGQLQTLRTRIAPIMRTKFRTYRDLLRAVQESEERLSRRSNRVSQINCQWLVAMLPNIEAAIRASIISPSEDAKEKLAKLDRIVIEPKHEVFSFTVILESEENLSLDEMKQAFQLLDMAVVDDDREGLVGDLINRIRKNVGLIEALSDVFTRLFASGCIVYTFRNRMVIQLDRLESEIKQMRETLNQWNNQWTDIENLRFLALFSRGYLIHLVDLIGRQKINDALFVIKCVLPHASINLEDLARLARPFKSLAIVDIDSWPTTEQLFNTLRELDTLLEYVFRQQADQVPIPSFLSSYGRTLESHFIDKAVVILNVARELLVGSSLAAYVSITRRRFEPSRILFITGHTDKEEIERFLTLWSVANNWDFFIMVHIERLSASGANAVRQGVNRVLPEHRGKLLLLAEYHHRTQSTKSLGARLGLVSDRLLEVHFTPDQLRSCFTSLLPNAANLYFFTSMLPGCGKSQRAMQLAVNRDYYRIPIRSGTVEELLASLKNTEAQSSSSSKLETFLHLDVAHSVSHEFNDILLSLLIHGALYDPKRARLGFWMVSPKTRIAIEFTSPCGMNEFPIIGYLGHHHQCCCDSSSFSYDLARMPDAVGQPVTVNQSSAYVAAGKFLQLKLDGDQGLTKWDIMCGSPDMLVTDPLPEAETFRLLVASFQLEENRNTPTFSALNALASFLHRHLIAMTTSFWFSQSAVYLFDHDQLARLFKTNVFDLLIKVANDSIGRCWSLSRTERKIPEMDWINRQRAMFLLGFSEGGLVAGMNIVGRDSGAMRAMFHPSLIPILEQQCLKFQELRGFKSLMQTLNGDEVIINAMRSLLLLDGTAASAAKVFQLDNHPRGVPAAQRLQQLVGHERGYVLTGDNITKMMFALYRIRCGLPVIAFGEAGVGKSALFRFLIQTLLGHTFEVCNVNSGTSIQDVEKMVKSAVTILEQNENSQVFLFFDEMNTADSPVIAFFKELMLDRHCNGSPLPKNLHLMAAANPYRWMHEADKEATVGLAFRFAPPSAGPVGRSLVYRVNELPLAFYDHIYDFGYLCSEAENTYIEEICLHGLAAFSSRAINAFASTIRKSHKAARALSTDPDSAVSLRDTTRAVTLLRWFCTSLAGRKIASSIEEAIDLAIYLVYAFRFRDRVMFLEQVFGPRQTASASMAKVSKTIASMLDVMAQQASIGCGAVALNDALCENLFALYVCVLNGIFLIIVGRPGSSKSLSVEILKLLLSPDNHEMLKQLGDLPTITEVYFQCSPLSTSSGFKALFHSAERLGIDTKTNLPLVVLDELGLADMSPEKPIKVLHSELERQSVLTSGDEQHVSHYSVVALSNWVVDAAQVNRGILIQRTEGNREDLLNSALKVAESLIIRYANQSRINGIRNVLMDSLKSIVVTYEAIDKQSDIGGGHFFSMRDFFFCVKNFVCSVFDGLGTGRINDERDARITDNQLIQSAIRNFGGHDKAQHVVRARIAKILKINQVAIATISPLELIVQNIQDSSKDLSIHIARHLMILNRSLIGLQLLNRRVRSKLDDGINWNVLFGSCFPGDFQVTAVTRKLRQVEQAIRTGGVIILCHADQLFESLYMVLNQQYWMQNGRTMTQIALGPSILPIALPDGPFRIIALQETDVALNRELMSPAVLSRFEKHELRPFHLLDDVGRIWLAVIESHPVWLTVSQSVKRQKLLYGYHEELFASLALHLQDHADPTESPADAHSVWMRAVNPMAMIKLERDPDSNFEMQTICQEYRRDFILEGVDDTLKRIPAKRLVVMTNTLRHMEIKLGEPYRMFIIQLFDIQTELELFRLLESIDAADLSDPHFCLVVQYDAVVGPIEQFQLTKYQIEQRFDQTQCRVVFVIHVDPRPVKMHWVFSFGDGWDYVFVDEVVPSFLSEQRIPLTKLVSSPVDQPLSTFVDVMEPEAFKSLLLEMLGPVLQTNMSSLRSNLGQFYSGVRTSLGLSSNRTMIHLLKDCLVAQIKEGEIGWNVVDAIYDCDFDSTSSLTEGLWNVFQRKISNPLAHLLLVSDVWHVSDEASVELWCQFVRANYPDRLMSLRSADSIVQIPTGFRCCSRPLGRLLASFDANFIQHPNSSLNGPLNWLINFIANYDGTDAQEMKQAYFLDWFVLRVPPHLHHCVRGIPLTKMTYLIDSLFEEPTEFVSQWENSHPEVVAALELLSIASFTRSESDDDSLWNDWTGRMRNWKSFSEALGRLALTVLTSPEVLNSHDKLIQSVSSIEVSPALTDLLDRLEDMQQLWLGLRITKRIFVFDSKSQIKLPELHFSTPQRLFDSLTDLVVTSVIRPRVVVSDEAGPSKRSVHQSDLYAILRSTSACTTTKELVGILGECPTTHSLVLLEDRSISAQKSNRCSSCNQFLKATEEEEVRRESHLRVPDEEFVDLLLQDYQKFMFFFERVAEIFIQQHRNNPKAISEFLYHLLSPDSRLQVSWRFLTVIARSVLSTRAGTVIIDGLLHTKRSIRSNRLSQSENSNACNLMRALLATADQDVTSDADDQRDLDDRDFSDAALVEDWSIERIHRLATFRHRLASSSVDAAVNVITQWKNWSRNQKSKSITETLLYFILRFSTAEGDETRLSTLLRNQQVMEILESYPIINGYIRNLSPTSLGFDLQSAETRAIPFQNRLWDNQRVDEGMYQHYPLLVRLQPEWAPFIARLAFHASDVFDTKNFRLLSRMVVSLHHATQNLLPGIENHPYLVSFTKEGFRWFLCDCGTLNCIGNCGNPTPESICPRCHRALSLRTHDPRAGIRRAVISDFPPPVGLHLARIPSQSPNFTVRNMSPAATRLALLLNFLALMNAALDWSTNQHSINILMATLPVDQRRPIENHYSLVDFLAKHVTVHLDLLCQLVVISRRQLTTTDKFRVGHLILHQLLDWNCDSLLYSENYHASGTRARDEFENILTGLVAQLPDFGRELDNLADQSNQAVKDFNQALQQNETLYWPYARLRFSNRLSVQLELARNRRLRRTLPFLNFLLDADNWTRKFDALQHLSEAIRFIAMVRTVLQNEITREEANRLTIRQGLDKIIDAVLEKPVLLDRGRPVCRSEHVTDLFQGFKQLWDYFSQIENDEKRTFLDYFECQQIDINVRPEPILEQSAPLILILAGSELPETTFSCQLLTHAVEAASSISLTPFIHPHCRAGSRRVQLSCSSTAALGDLDESLYAHVPTEEIDSFIRDHVIDSSTLRLAESFAMAAILGPTGSTIAGDLTLDTVPEFVFKDDNDSNNYLLLIERRSLVWQPSAIPNQIQELILVDLEKNRSLTEAKDLLISVITHLQSSSEPLIASQIRNNSVSDILMELKRAEILTDRHMSTETLAIFNRYCKLEVRHAIGLLKAIMCRMKVDDVFGGRIPIEWGTMMSQKLVQATTQKLREYAHGGDIVETLLILANTVTSSHDLPEQLKPDQPLLLAIRHIEGTEWDGLPVEIPMANLGHVLLIAEGLTTNKVCASD